MNLETDITDRYDTARKIRDSQDQYCSKALAGEWTDLGELPDELQWEALVDVLRGRVKVISSVSYTSGLLNMQLGSNSLLRGNGFGWPGPRMCITRFLCLLPHPWLLVKISNEFKFPIAAFHHAMEAYLVPDLLKKAYGKSIHSY